MCQNLQLQIFNELNARKPDEVNVFKGVTTNRLFMGIVGITLALQVKDARTLYIFFGPFVFCVLDGCFTCPITRSSFFRSLSSNFLASLHQL